MFVDDDGNPLVSTSYMDSKSEVEVVFDETTNLLDSASSKGRNEKGYGNNSLLEQWTKTNRDDDYDPYDEDLYSNTFTEETLYPNKKDERGIMIKNKTRLVAQRYTQEEGIDYDEVFAPVAKIKSIMLFLAYALFKDFVMYQMEVKSAFLYRKIEEEVYVCQPLGFEDPDFLGRVYKVEKGTLWTASSSRSLMISFLALQRSLCTKFEKMMHKKFQMSFMGELIFFLGLRVKQKKDGIFISQDKYVTENVKTASTPMETQKLLLKDEDGEEMDVHLYRSMMGSLMYLTSSRPIIMFAVCACVRYQVNPKILHLHVVKRIFSDYAGASLDRKSTTGEAEYVAASSCCGQVFWIQNQLLDYRTYKDGVWKFLIHTILQCLSAKTTAWNEFSSTMASAIICLATNQKFNFSKYIFESMVKNLDNAGKFLMYPRFIQVFLDKQLEGMSSHKRIYVTPSHTKKIFGNMKRVGKGFSGRETPLFPIMVVQDQAEMGEGLAIPTDPHHTPTIIQPSTSQPQKKQRSRRPKRNGTEFERAVTTATGLDAEQDRGNINKTQSKATPNEPSSPGTKPQDVIAKFCGPSWWKELSKERVVRSSHVEMDPAGRRSCQLLA
ncbi:putative ribonuclease H-like domain-containing protein [Tanacetum coccineum]